MTFSSILISPLIEAYWTLLECCVSSTGVSCLAWRIDSSPDEQNGTSNYIPCGEALASLSIKIAYLR